MASIVTNTIPVTSRKYTGTNGKPQHTYTVRYRDPAGKQHEDTFKKLEDARAFKAEQEHKKTRLVDVNRKAGRDPFNNLAEAYLGRLAVSDRSRESYLGNFHKHVLPAYAGKSVREASQDRGIAEDLLNATMLEMSIGVRRQARMIIVGALDSAVAAGTIESHRLAGIKLAEKTTTEDDSEDGGFVFITDDQVATLAEKIGIAVWLQRTMGLRIGEALGVEKSDFIHGGTVLRLKWQATRDGKSRVPLKKRKAGQFRDIPVPAFIQAMIRTLPDGPLTPGISTRYATYGSTRDRFMRTCKALGIEGFTTHSLRHQFASECLEAGMNVVDLANVLGHSDPSVTLRIYVHAVPDAFERTRDMMNARWSRPVLKAA